MQKAQDMASKAPIMVIYKKDDEKGGYMVGTPEQATNYLMTGKTKEDLDKMFITKIQKDIAKGFKGLGNSLEELNNLDTSKIKPEGKLMFEYLNLKVNTVPGVAEDSKNPIKDKIKDNFYDKLESKFE